MIDLQAAIPSEPLVDHFRHLRRSHQGMVVCLDKSHFSQLQFSPTLVAARAALLLSARMHFKPAVCLLFCVSTFSFSLHCTAANRRAWTGGPRAAGYRRSPPSPPRRPLNPNKLSIALRKVAPISVGAIATTLTAQHHASTPNARPPEEVCMAVRGRTKETRAV